jgi:acetolactate synthase-1/2/3 large subunit
MNGAEYVVRTLQARGVERVYALCGNGLAPFFDACGALGMPVVDVRNEQSAAYMADVWGRMTGRLGVVAVSSGPGHTNALTGLANAWWDGGPLLLISGQSDDETRGLDHFQELDQVAMAAPVAKVARRVHHVTALGFMLDEAIAQATAQRPGPAHLTIPEDVFLAPLAEEPEPLPAAGPAQVQAVGPADPDLARRAVEMLAAAERPFLLVGSGAFYSGAWEPLRRLAQAADVPILTHIWDRGCIEEAIPQYVGVTNEELNGAMGSLAEADLLVAVGARLDHRVGYGRPPALSPDARVIRIDADPAELGRGRRADLAIAGEPRAALEAMADLAEARGEWAGGGWLAEVRGAVEALKEDYAALCLGDECPMPGLRICQELRPFLERDVTFLLDGGNIGRWAHLWLFDRHPAHWMTCGASGVVGWGVGGAVAARQARPERPVLLLSGDGAAGFTFTDVETALRFGTPYVMVIAHDGAWGIVADAQPAGRRVASELGTIRFDLLARAMGARGVLIEHPAALAPAAEEALALDTVTVIQVPTVLGGLSAYRRGC